MTHDRDATFERAEALHRAGRLDEARLVYEEVLRQQRQHYDALYQLGILAMRTGRMRCAVELFDAALAARPDSANALNSRGSARENLGDGEAALADYRAAIALEPASPAPYANAAAVLRRLGRAAEALAMADQAVALRPDFAAAHSVRGNALHDLGRAAEAVGAYDRAIASWPDFAAAYANRGNGLRDLGRFDEALADCDHAIALDPNSALAHGNRGTVLSDLGRFVEASESFDRALILTPRDARALINRGLNRFNHSLALLADGDYRRGWPMFEARWQSGQLRPRTDLPGAPWSGEPALNGKTILVHSEQGFGDSLQFCRYLPMLAARARVVLQVERGLLRLLAGLDGVSVAVAGDEALPPFDAWIPMLSLPRAFHTTLETIPAAVPYLRADPEQAAAWRRRLSRLPGRKIGLAWAGAARLGHQSTDQRRSMELARFAPLAALAGLCLISLQKGDAAVRSRDQGLSMMMHDWTNELNDFADTAALVEALDLVISVDTSVAHLAGALAKPVWVLNRYDRCWRWLRDRNDSPWYPTARLFTQRSPGDWDGVIAEVADALRA